jgi:Coenzyme PQQ synthesis protein D (PqqD)
VGDVRCEHASVPRLRVTPYPDDVTSPQYRRSDDVVFEVAGDRAVLLDAAGKELITLNPVGSLVWQMLGEPHDAAGVAAALHAAFPDVPKTKLEDDANAFLAELVASELVVHDAAS